MLKIVTFSILGLGATAQTFSPFQKVFSVHCDSSFEFFENIPFGFNVQLPIIKNAVEVFLDTIFDNLECPCPGITPDEFRLAFDPFAVLLNKANGTERELNECIKNTFPFNLDQIDFIRITTLPDTCNIDSYLNPNEGCNLAYKPNPLSTLQLSLSTCPGSFFPKASLTCSGPWCQYLLRPCQPGNTSDCGPFSCVDIDALTGGNLPSLVNFIVSEFLFVFSNDTYGPLGCHQATGQSQEKTPENDIITYLITLFANLFYEMPGVFNQFAVCLPSNFQEIPLNLQNQNPVVPLSSIVTIESDPTSDFCFLPPPGSSLGSLISLVDSDLTFTQTEYHSFLSTYAHCVSTIKPYIEVGNCDGFSFSSSCNDLLENLADEIRKVKVRPINTPMSFLEVEQFTERLLLTAESWDVNQDGYVEVYEVSPAWLVGLNITTHVLDIINRQPSSIPLPTVQRVITKLGQFFNKLIQEVGIEISAKKLDLIYDINNILYTESENNSTSQPFICFPGNYNLQNFVDDYFQSIIDSVASMDLDSSGLFESLNINGQNEIENLIQNIPVESQLDAVQTTFTIEQVVAAIEILKEQLVNVFQWDQESGFSALEREQFYFGRYILLGLRGIVTDSEMDSVNVADVFSLFNSTINDGYFVENGMAVSFSDPFLFEAVWNDPTRAQGLSLSAISLALTEIEAQVKSLDTDGSGFIEAYEVASSISFDMFYGRQEDIVKFDFGLFAYLEQGKTYTFRPTLFPWDGKDSNGIRATEKDRSFPPFTRNPSKFELVRFTCEKDIIFDNNNFGIVFNSKFRKLLDSLTELLYDIVLCSSNPPSREEFINEFGILDLQYWLFYLDPSKNDFNISFIDLLVPIIPKVGNIPESCSYNRYVSEGICQVDFKGIQSLLLIDITLRLTASKCGIDDNFSSYSIECIGQDCPIFNGLTSCDSSNSCFGNLVCSDLPQRLNQIINIIQSNPDFFPPILPPELSFVPEMIIDLIFQERNLLTLILSEDFCYETTPNSNSGCLTPSSWFSDLHRIIVGIFGSSNQPASVNQYLQFCLLDLNSTAIDLETWVSSLFTFDNFLLNLGNDFASTTIQNPSSCLSSYGFSTTPIGQVAHQGCNQVQFYGSYNRQCGLDGKSSSFVRDCQLCPSGSIILDSTIPTTIDDCVCQNDLVMSPSYECIPNPCQTNNGGCNMNAKCSYQSGSISCQCIAGFTGDGYDCQDFDECSLTAPQCPADRYCVNTFGSFVCPCLPGFDLFSGACVPNTRTASIATFTPIGRWLFNLNTLDSSTNRRPFFISGKTTYVDYYQRFDNSNKALRVLTGFNPPRSANPIPIDPSISFELVFNVENPTAVDLISLTRSLSLPRNQYNFILEITWMRKLRVTRRGVVIGTSSGSISGRQTRYLVVTFGNNLVNLFVDDVSYGSFRFTDLPTTDSFVVIGKGLNGHIDEFAVMNSTLSDNQARSRNDLLVCNAQGCTSGRCGSFPEEARCL